MKRCLVLVAWVGCLFMNDKTNAQSVSLNAGVWQGFSDPAYIKQYPFIKGRLCNVSWKDIEPSNNSWNWTTFDSELTERVKDSLPVIFSIFTYEDAPDWIYDYGVPKVRVNDANGNFLRYAPYFSDTDYINLFQRMISSVRKHMDSLPASIRRWIVGVEGAMGSTGDFIGYQGEVASEYYLSNDDFDSLYKKFASYFNNEYKNTSPRIHLLTNPGNSNAENQLYTWFITSCPNSWVKQGTIGKAFQLNDEVSDSSFLYHLMNTPQNGEYTRARCEITKEGAWFYKNTYRNMFAIMANMIYWGFDWSNQGLQFYTDNGYKAAYNFFNKYAGQKDPFIATNAVCFFKDGLDASDGDRFPELLYGTLDRNNTLRYTAIAAAYALKGALEEDPLTATLGDFDNLSATGINDVGWNVFSNNYERWLHQINPNGTSVGYWNVSASAEPNSMYGKYARAFDVASGKNTFYFDVDKSFLRNAPLNGAYSATISITYLDKGTGGFKLYYDSKNGGTDKLGLTVNCGNTNKWLTATVTLNDAYFGNRALSASDFYFKSTSTTENVIFSHVELSRPAFTSTSPAMFATDIPTLDTTCFNGVSASKYFVLSGYYLDGTPVSIGPLAGFKFALGDSDLYTDSLTITGYGTNINRTVYVKFYPSAAQTYQGNILVKGGGISAGINVFAKATAINSLPNLNTVVANISCNGKEDGTITNTPAGGTGPFTYNWTKASSSTWKRTTEDVSSLAADTYTLVFKSSAGCATTTTYTIIEPSEFHASIAIDSPIICKGGNTTVTITGTGGTLPYSGTGTFTQGGVYKSYDVSDARGCKDNQHITISNGTQSEPGKPTTMNDDDAENRGLCNGGNYIFSTNAVSSATSYTWTLPNGGSIVSSQNNGLSITAYIPAGNNSRDVSVKANNNCGSSSDYTKTIKALPAKPSSVTGLSSVSKNATGKVYSVTNEAGVTYTWTVPTGASITAGQNTSSITVTFGTKSGNVTAKATNNCGSSTGSAKYVTVKANLTGDDDSTIEATDAFVSEETDTSFAVAAGAHILIAPNPATDMFTISLSGNKNISSIAVYNMQGRLVLQKKTNASIVRVLKNELGGATGVYLVDIISGTQHFKQKVVVY